MTRQDPIQTSQARNALLVMAKRPAPGQTKTRLSPPLSPEHACSLYERFLMDTIALMRAVPETQPVIVYLPEEEEAYFSELAPDFQRLPQRGPDLGLRLENALSHYLGLGYKRVVIMDSDSPTLPGEYLRQAFEALEDHDVVIGPCDDGGYYLIGMKRRAPRLLKEVRMSTPQVTAETLALADKMGLKVAQLPAWYDVDDAESLRRLCQELDLLADSRAIHTRRFLSNERVG